MADDQQQETSEKVNVPESVETGAHDPNERGKYLKMMEDHKELAKEFGEPDFQSLLTRVGSDGNFATQLVMHLIAGTDKPTGFMLPDAPQENNVTGKLDHTGDVAKRIVTKHTVPAMSKSSGIDGDAGDWTEHGDGTEYPEA